MSSNRLRLLLVSVMAVFAISAVASASASAATCYKVAPGETGHWLTNACNTTGATKEYVLVEKIETDLGSGVLCAKVIAGEPSAYKNNTCTEKEAGTGKYTKVLENANEQQQFVNSAGTEVVGKKGFTSKSSTSTLKAGTNTVTCTSDTDKGELLGKESVQKVVVTFTGCKVKATNKKGEKVECPISSKGIANTKGEIVTASLKGELGESAESATGVVLLLEPESGITFVTLNATVTCETPETKINGQVAGEVTPLGLGLTDKVVFANKIKSLERSFELHCAGGVECTAGKEDQVVKPRIEAFGVTATFETTDENRFEQEVRVLAGA